jgi:hypothetical protein
MLQRGQATNNNCQHICPRSLIMQSLYVLGSISFIALNGSLHVDTIYIAEAGLPTPPRNYYQRLVR